MLTYQKYFSVFIFLFSLTAFSNQELKLVGKMDKYPSYGYSSIWGYTDPNGREYALLGVQSGTSIVDITDDNNFVEVAFVKGKMTKWRELKTYSHYAYVATDAVGDGIQIIDLSKLPLSAKVVGKAGPMIPTNHNVWVDEKEKLLYACGGDNGSVTIYDLSNPVDPELITYFNSPTYVHDVFVKDGKAYLSEIFTNSLSVYDVQNPFKPKLLKRISFPGSARVSVHNAWLTEDGNYLLSTEESKGLTVKMWDIRDLKNPKIVSEYLGENKLAHNIHVKGNYAYLSHYAAGVKVLDISDPTNLVEVGHFSLSDPTKGGFRDAWGIYPYFKSGKIAYSDIEDGQVVVYFEGAKGI